MDEILEKNESDKTIFNKIRNRKENKHVKYGNSVKKLVQAAEEKYLNTIPESLDYSSNFFKTPYDKSSNLMEEDSDFEIIPKKDLELKHERTDEIESSELSENEHENMELGSERTELKKHMKHEQNYYFDENKHRVQFLQGRLNQERMSNTTKFTTLISHYERILQKANDLNDQMLREENSIQTKVDTLKEQLNLMQSNLQRDLKNDFDNLLQGLVLPENSDIFLSPNKLKFSDSEEKQENILEIQRPVSKGSYTKKIGKNSPLVCKKFQKTRNIKNK